MGGKSRKSGGVSRKLIAALKGDKNCNNNKSKKDGQGSIFERVSKKSRTTED
jgi:hypothetical protein